MSTHPHYSRRQFLGGALTTGASATVLNPRAAFAAATPAGEAKPPEFARQIKLGLIGYDNIVQGRCDNPTAQQAGDDALTAVLGREACARRTGVTMAELIAENQAPEYDLTGLKV